MIRIFRADKPHDVAIASLVASTTVGVDCDFLAVSGDKTEADREPYIAAMRATALQHDWRNVIDLTGLPLNDHWLPNMVRGSRIEVMRAHKESAKMIRERVAGALASSLDGHAAATDVDEVYVPCLDQPDIQLFCAVLRQADINALPHGFNSLAPREVAAYTPHVLGTGPSNSIRSRTIRFAKHSLWGSDAAVPGAFPVKTVYTFDRKPEWNAAVVDLAPLLTPSTMRRMFDGFPADVRSYFDELADELGSNVVVLLIPPVEQIAGQPFAFALEALASLADDLRRTFRPASVLVKPHPISGARWVHALCRHLATAHGVRVVEKHHYLPIEVVLSAFAATAVCALGSTALQTIHRIYGLPIYSRDTLLRQLYGADRDALDSIDRWIHESAGSEQQI